MVAERSVDAHAVGSRRAAWRIIARVEQKDAQQATHEREYAGKVEAELPEICDSILALKDKNFVSSTTAGVSNKLYFKTKGDYYQDLAKSVTGDAKSKVAERPYPEYLDVQYVNPIVQTMEKTVDVPQMQYIGRIDDVSVVMQCQIPPFKLCRKRWKCHKFNFMIEWLTTLSCCKDRLRRSEFRSVSLKRSTFLFHT